MNPTSFRIPFTGTLSESPDTEELLYDIWAALKGEVQKQHLLSAGQLKKKLGDPEGPQGVFKDYLDYPDIEKYEIDCEKGYVELVFPSPGGMCNVSAALSCHWFRHALAKKPGPVRKLLKAEGLTMGKPDTPEQIKASEKARFVNLNNAYYMILPGEEKIASWDEGGEIAWDGLEEFQKREVDRLLEQDHCGCHLCYQAREKERVPKARTEEEAVTSFMAWAEENLEGTPQNVTVYFKKEMVFLGQLENCYILTYTLEGSETLIAFSGPLVHGLKGISLATYKQSYTKEHKMLISNYAAAFTILEHLRENRSELLGFDQDEETWVREIFGPEPLCDDMASLDADFRLNLAGNELWFFRGVMRRGAYRNGGVRGKRGSGKPLERKALILTEVAEEERCDFNMYVRVEEDYAHSISEIDDPKSRYPLDYSFLFEKAIGRYAGPYACYWDGIFRCLDDPAWQWWRYVTEQD